MNTNTSYSDRQKDSLGVLLRPYNEDTLTSNSNTNDIVMIFYIYFI